MSETISLAVCDASELKDGEMKQFDLGDKGKVLLSKVGGKINATSAFCTHYGAPLAKGVLDKTGRVVCPWHGACFNVCTGDIEDSPGTDALYVWKATTTSDGKIEVTAPVSEVTSKTGRSPLKSVQAIAKQKEPKSTEKTVIVGGGAGAIHCLESLRQHGYTGQILVISKESYPPIDRTKLSKALLTDPSKLAWRSEEILKTDFNVDLQLNTTVTKVDPKAKTVTTDKSSTPIEYTNLVLSPGSFPRKIPIEGVNLEEVYTLRYVEDAQKIVAGINENAKIAIIGTSFIGMEIAGSIAGKKPASIDIIGMDPIPFEKILGKEIGEALQKNLEEKGVKFHMNAKVEKIVPSKSDPKKVGAVQLQGEDPIECSLLVLGTGVGPATQFLADSGFELEKDKGIQVNEFCEVEGYQNIYAIGDIVHFPQFPHKEKRRIEHWNCAGDQGRVVGQNIAVPTEKKSYSRCPYFWSSVGGGVRYVGFGSGQDDIYIKGDLSKPSELKFIAYYSKNNEVFAVASCKSDPYVSKASELMRLQQMPTMSEIKAGKDIMEIDISGKIGN